MSHLFISAAHKSSGKTTLSIGICAALAARGLVVAPFKKGPDYIDPLWLSQAANRACLNLDFYTMSRDEIRAGFSESMIGAEIGVIEGNKGLYDGLDLDGSNSNAALAVELGSPVVLVLDTRGMTRGVAPLIRGYQDFEPDIHIAGVILNQVGGSRHEAKLRQVIEHYTDVTVVGSVGKNPDLQLVERHLGLMPSNESSASAEQIARIGKVVAEEVDLDALVGISYQAKSLPDMAQLADVTARYSDLKIGYARDAAFGFYYQDDLQRLAQLGAALIPFDTLNDTALPEMDAMFLGGGFPEVHIDELAANQTMLAAIRQFAEQDRPIYAECGGLMYLCQNLTWNGKTGKMVGAIPADVVMHEKPQGRGYVRLLETAEHPWAERSSSLNRSVVGHEFHYSQLENMASDLKFAYRVERGFGIDGQHDGLVHRRIFASYAHLRGVGGNPWPERFLAWVGRDSR